MHVSATTIFIVTGLLAIVCKADTGAQIKGPNDISISQKPNEVTVFITGNTLGQLKPCGCSGGQLGGFDRRGPLLDKVPANRRLLLDTGNFIAKADEQDLIKYDIIMQALGMCNYDVVNLTRQDAQIGTKLGLFEGNPFKVLSTTASPGTSTSFTKSFDIDGRRCNLAVAAIELDQIADATKAFENHKDAVKILVVNGHKSAPLEMIQGVDVIVVQASDTDTPGVLTAAKKEPMIITAGNRGKYVGKLDISCDANGAKVLGYIAIPVSEKLPADASLVNLYKAYQGLVRDANLLEKFPRLVLPDKQQYIGSNICGRKDCHPYEYGKWKEKKHAIAMKSLEEVGSDRDPECVTCHVVGMEYKTGYISPEKNDPDIELGNVGCESCHGPSSEHFLKAKKGVKTPVSDANAVCTKCHTPEQSPDFSAKEKEYREKIVHWKEPKAPKNVKQ